MIVILENRFVKEKLKKGDIIAAHFCPVLSLGEGWWVKKPFEG
jgi:hypothetical protein